MNMKIPFALISSLVLAFGMPIYAVQNEIGTIRGRVFDRTSDTELPFATLQLVKSDSVIATAQTDTLGLFCFQKLSPGRYDLKATYLGYSPGVLKELLVTSGHDLIVSVPLTENSSMLDEVVVKPYVNKAQPLNNMALTGGRMLAVEEASRYAGGLDDPARLASSFAGVATNVGDNGIVVRGNAPKFLQWKIEDVEVPNPNHFAEIAGFGAGGLAAISSNVLGNSDFFTGAFPAEYGNALSGVFDIKLRNGNNSKYEHAFALGTMGIDVASQGPLKKNSRASYIFNYRYSTLALMSSFLPEGAENMRYQDLSFKFNIPTRKHGTFSIWGVGLIDSNGEDAKTNPQEWEYMNDREGWKNKLYMGAFGIAHRININDRSFLKTTLAGTVNGIKGNGDVALEDGTVHPENSISKLNTNIILNSYINTKFSARHTNRSGLTLTALLYDMNIRNSKTPGTPLLQVSDNNGAAALIEAHTNSSFALGNRWKLNAGLHVQYLTLNNHYSIEPRLSSSFELDSKSTLSAAFGMHSRMEMLNYYFTEGPDGELYNKNLDFTRALHFSISWQRTFGENFRLLVEPYVQYLYSVPVSKTGTFSFLNLKDEWYIMDELTNIGKGFNYGVDVTFEKYMTNGFYFMFTGSLYNARYRAADGTWRNTRFNRNFLLNGLAGKEWMVGKTKRNMWSLNLKLTFMGGDRFSPVDYENSILNQDVVFDETKAYSSRLSPILVGHFTVSYRINRRKLSHEFAFKMLNCTGYAEYFNHAFNYKTQKVDIIRDGIAMPNIYYKIEF